MHLDAREVRSDIGDGASG